MVMVAAAALVTVTACGGASPSSAGSASGGAADQALAYSQCMRAHGVPDFPDPNASGNFQVAPGSPNDPLNTPQEQVANDDCQRLLSGGGTSTGGENQQAVSQDLKLAECMRTHGAANFPDPTVHGNSVYFQGNFDYDSPLWQKAEQACKSLAPAGFFSSTS